MITRIESGAQSMLNYLGDAHLWHWRHIVISETPGQRLVAQYVFQPDLSEKNAEAIETVGKFYADTDTGQHCYQAMRSVHAHLTQHQNAPLAIPKPLFYDQNNRLLILNWVSGEPFFDLLTNPQFEQYFWLAGKALAFLHNLPMNFGEVKTLDDNIAELITPHPSMLAQKLPEQNERIAAIIRRLQIVDSQLGTIKPVPLHRDFHLRQLFYEQDKLWLIDWDMYALGNPALDIGNFITYLETKIPTQANTAIAAFLEGYQVLRPDISARNVRLYQAFTYLRLACKAYRLQAEDWGKRIDHYLATCERLLAQEDAK